MSILKKLLMRFAACRRGVTAVEFAFILPILLFFLVGILEFSTMFMAQNSLENAMNYAARLGKTGYIQAGMTREQFLLSLIKQRIHGLMDTSLVTMNTEVYQDLDKIGKPEAYTDANHNGVHDTGETYTDTNHNGVWDTDQGSSGQGDDGDVVVYTVNYPWQVMTPFLRQVLADDGKVTLSSRLVVKNEPYANGT